MMSQAERPAPLRVVVERDTVNDDSVIVRSIVVTSGTVVGAGARVLDIETSKTVAEVLAPAAGTVVVVAAEGEEVAIGGLLFEVHGTLPAAPAAAARGAAVVADRPLPVADVEPPAPAMTLLSQAAEALSAEMGVPPEKLPATGWVTRADVRAALGLEPGRRAAAPARPAPQPVSAAGAPGERSHRVEPLSKRKQVEIRSLERGNAHGVTSTIGVTVAIRGPRLVRPPALFRDSISDLVILEGARLLRSHPRLNACWLDERRVALFDEVNFGLSFDSGGNLKVLTLPAADERGLGDIQREFIALLDLYESEAPLDASRLTGSTVTLTDLSVAGASLVVPLLNGDQALIIGITRGAVGDYGLVATFDHRIADGLDVTRFLRALAGRIESYFRPSAAAAVDLRCSACDKRFAEELELGGRGLVRVVLASGEDGLLCRNCLDGG
jgi:pyruvate/2-oxoglutarate dehydrogenase complex dihydrolipoamide acyltransferase (E2) component